MNTQQRLTHQFGLTYRIIQRQVEGLTHEDSVVQLPFRGNCLNWVLGHILDSRQGFLGRLGHPSLMSEEERARYTGGSKPVTNGEECMRFERLMELLHESQAQILAALETVTDEELTVVADEERKRTLDDVLSFLQWHETYHTGQLEYLRQLTGTNDHII